jgi:hypothetical protein
MCIVGSIKLWTQFLADSMYLYWTILKIGKNTANFVDFIQKLDISVISIVDRASSNLLTFIKLSDDDNI